MRVISFGKTDIGKRRQINQDAFLIAEELGFYAVADGMGGHAAGEVAAHESVEAAFEIISNERNILESFRQNPIGKVTAQAICRLVESSIQSATYLIYGIAEQKPSYQGMGTTFSTLLLVGAYAVTGQVGDSRVYAVRDGTATQLTHDHTLVNWQINEGILTPEEAKYSPHKNVITRAVGNKDYVQVDTQIIPVYPGDRFLLCSDGLHGYLQSEEIPHILAYGPSTACDVLIDLANQRGGKDNITAIVIEVSDH